MHPSKETWSQLVFYFLNEQGKKTWATFIHRAINGKEAMRARYLCFIYTQDTVCVCVFCAHNK